MFIQKIAMAGTLESSDAQIMVEPADNKLELVIESSVMNQYGRQIKATVQEKLQQMQVTCGRITVIDKGALECTLKARLECALLRSCDASHQNIAWGDLL